MTTARSNPSPARATAPSFEQALKLCIEKSRLNIKRLADDPKTCALDADGNYFNWPEGFFEIGNWTSSFFTGMALLSHEITGDREILRQVNRLAGHYHDKVWRHGMDTMHDLGFLYSLYSVALWKITGSQEQRSLGIKAAEELAKRFVPLGNYIQAWGRMDDRRTDYQALAIIDCMMNLPLLFWASEQTGNDFFHQVALRHADTTAGCFVRADASVCHAYRFDPTTGAPLREDNYCGASIGSHWARGTAWAIYGFALAHRYTGKASYLEVSRKLADRFLELLGPGIAPKWDFRLAAGSKELLDSSASAVLCCGLYELARASVSGKAHEEAADRILAGLCADFLNTDLAVPGLLRDAQVGDGVGRSKNAYTSWGDYYFMEALARRVHKHPGYW